MTVATVRSGMSGFLVLVRGACDDVPVGLFANRQDAVKAAMAAALLERTDTPLTRAPEGWPEPSDQNVAVLEFRDGLPCGEVMPDGWPEE